MADLIIQRVVFPADRSLSSLYFRVLDNPFPRRYAEPAPRDRRSLVLGRGARIDTNSYFNCFYEAYWRRHTTLGRLVLHLVVTGRGTVRLWRACAESGTTEVGRAEFDGENVAIEIETPGPLVHFREFGTLYFEVIAAGRSVTLASADWTAPDAKPEPVELVAGYCTFDREAFVLSNVGTLSDDPGLAGYLKRIVVVDQGAKKVKNHPDYRCLSPRAAANLLLFEQENFGGAGGFTRCILEARRLEGATHVLLLDDDATVEPESVFRTATFLSLAKQQFAVGGPMLDLLRPTEMYEAGGFVIPAALGVDGHCRNLPLQTAANVQSLAEPKYAHYNAWWFFAFPLAAADRLGLPLPLFIRGDDVEFGCRLMRGGIHTITLPGLAVWHVPLYLKQRSWNDYYFHRNLLVTVAMHFPVSRIALACTVVRVLLHRLLMLDYFKAWALCEAVDDYLTGPQSLTDDPLGVHRRVLEAYRRLSPGSLPKTNYLRTIAARPIPASQIRQTIGAFGAVLRQLVRASPAKDALPTCALDGNDEHWYALRRADVMAVDDRYSEEYVVLRRDRRKFVSLLARGVWSAMRLLATYGGTVRQWQQRAKRLAEPGFWREYLGTKAAIDDPKGNVVVLPPELPAIR